MVQAPRLSVSSSLFTGNPPLRCLDFNFLCSIGLVITSPFTFHLLEACWIVFVSVSSPIFFLLGRIQQNLLYSFTVILLVFGRKRRCVVTLECFPSIFPIDLILNLRNCDSKYPNNAVGRKAPENGLMGQHIVVGAWITCQRKKPYLNRPKEKNLLAHKSWEVQGVEWTILV